MTTRKQSALFEEEKKDEAINNNSSTAPSPTVLAKVFVPKHLKLVNRWQATVHLVADRPFTSQQQPPPTLVPMFPLCCRCGVSHAVPSPPVLPDDMYYSLYHNVTTPPPSPPRLRGTDHIASIEEYVRIWRGLLMAERKAKLILYENFSQYQQSVHFQTQTTPNNIAYMTAQTSVHGIADTIIDINDTVLLRPTRRLSWILPDQSTLHRVAWSPPNHVIEIQSNVLRKQRHPHKSDRLYFNWLTPVQFNLLQQSMHTRGTSNSFNIRLVPSIQVLERCWTALEWLQTNKLPIETLSPRTAPSVNSFTPVDHPQLNPEQNTFLNMVMDRTDDPSKDLVRGPMILTGPAGVGKTKTLLAAVHTVLEAHSQFRILVCTPSHTAADVVTRRLGRKLDRQELFRLFDADRPVATVPPEVLGFCHQDNSTGSFVLPDDILRYRVIVCTCVDAHLLYRIGLTNQQLRARRKCLQKFLQETCPGANLQCTLDGVDTPHFTHLFIDEAAQATEPESIIPLSVVVDPLPGNRKVEIAFVGDPRQLSPQVHCSQAANAGLARSWMERLLASPVKCFGGGEEHLLGQGLVNMSDWLQYSFRNDGRERLSVFLTLNYRGHPSFLMMPSVLFYSDRLQSGVTSDRALEGFWCEKLRHVETLSRPVVFPAENEPEDVRCRKQFQWPIHFRGVNGRDVSVSVKSGFSSGAWTNPPEAEAVVEIVSELVSKGVETEKIGVMAAFRGQVVVIRKMFREKNLGTVNVGTIEDYQAVEREVIVLSLTRAGPSFFKNDIAHRMGVFGQPKRSNVAMTRAESLFIVVGSPMAMAADFVWRQFMLFCHRNGLYYGDPPVSEAILRWHESNKVVQQKPDELDTDTVMVSSLEMLLRNDC